MKILVLISALIVSVITKTFPVSWVSTKITGTDVGVGFQGDTFIVGTDNQVYRYNQATNIYNKITSLFDAKRIAVSKDGTPYVISKKGNIFYLSLNNEWIQIEGCANDIAVGRNNELWIIGCDIRKGGFGIWKFKCDNLIDTLPHNLFTSNKSFKNNNKYQLNSCNWFRIEGSGIKIAVDIDGQPTIITEEGDIFRYDGQNYKNLSKIKSLDIAISNENILFAIDLNNQIFVLKDSINEEWDKMTGLAIAISVGPYSLPFAVSYNNIVYSSATLGYTN